ncbi:MAG: zf-HC2 domain-containing protein, partial [Pirellulales bacterium]|nr:zf-HC2 domain-containing protein [Pirellulales bacterium]
MTELPQEELLSAYLDGELTAAEKARAEKLLAEDPSAQATLDCLREVSSAVKSLPAFKL